MSTVEHSGKSSDRKLTVAQPFRNRIESERGNYKAWFANVAEAISSGDRSRLIVTPEAAALTIEIIEAATVSSREGRRVDL